MKLIAAFVDTSVFGHKRSYLKSFFLNSLGQCAAKGGKVGSWNVRGDFLGNEEYFFALHRKWVLILIVSSMCKYTNFSRIGLTASVTIFVNP